MDKIAVVEIWNRTVESITECDTIEEAIETANELLRLHVDDNGRLDDFERGVGEDTDWLSATEETKNAWCNRRGDWDAHIIEY